MDKLLRDEPLGKVEDEICSEIETKMNASIRV